MMLNNLGRVFMVLGLVVAVAFAAVYLWTEFLQTTAEQRGETGEKERVVADPDYRIANRDWYFDQCSAIAAKQDEIATTEQQMKSASGGYKEQLRGAKFAQEQELNRLVNEYNSRAANEQSGGQWRDKELPPHIEADEEVSCGSA